jgi:aminopeptidase N
MPSLTRIEAVTRAALIQVDGYRIQLDLTEDGPEFWSRTVIRFRSRRAGEATFVDIKAAAVSRITLNERPLDPSEIVAGRLVLKDLAPDNELVVEAQMSYSSDGEGLHRHVDPADGQTYLYAMSFLDAAPRWFACFDQPDLKAPFDISVRCAPEWTVLGNGAAHATAAGNWTLETTKPLSTYFVTLVAGPYHSVRSQHDGIVLGVHARRSLAEHLDREASEMLAVTAAAFDRYHQLFGVRYPFGEYHQAFVPDFNAGAMENPGCVTFRDQFVFRSATTKGERAVRANTIAHEMAHMWFGDLVTMRWWDDLWLNESFAEYMSYRVCSEVTDFAVWEEFGIKRKDWGYVADQAPSTHPVAGNGSADAAGALADFDGISYAKGAACLKQLAAFLGDDVFFAGLRDHFGQHAYGNAEFSDLIAAWTRAGAVGLSDWAAAWLRTSGLDTLLGDVRDGQIVLQRTSPDASRRPHAIRVAGYSAEGEQLLDEPVLIAASQDILRLAPLGGTESLGGTKAACDVAVVVPDAGDDSWAKIRFGAGFSGIGSILPSLSSATERVVVYNSVKDAVRDAELDPLQALGIVLAAAGTELEDFVVAELFHFATTVLAGTFAPVAQRHELHRRVARTAQSILDTARAGSDRQLVAARAVVAATVDAGDIEQWLSGAAVPDGLKIDDELRWSIVERLSGLAALSEQQISAELDRDRSTSGVVHAARARALQPTEAAKHAAWTLLVEPGDTPAYELYATAEGFFEPGQCELTAPFLGRYFREMPATAGHRHGWALGRIALLAYPTAHASASSLALAAEALAADGLDPVLRRSLVDGTDVARRALASQARFASR